MKNIQPNRDKWNEWGFRPPLGTYRLNWARITFWGWWDEWDDTALQTHDSKFELWRSEAEHAIYWSRRLPTILSFMSGWGRNIFVPFKPPRRGTEYRTLRFRNGVWTNHPRAGPLLAQSVYKYTTVRWLKVNLAMDQMTRITVVFVSTNYWFSQGSVWWYIYREEIEVRFMYVRHNTPGSSKL